MSILEFNNVSKTFQTKKNSVSVIKNMNFKVDAGEIVCIVGPSGSGKSTILNLIAGLIKPDMGKIQVNGKIGYMFQRDLLFEWRTIMKNIMLGLEINHQNKQEEVAINLLSKYGLLDFKDSYPNELSGGMRQRIALIRTLITKPSLLLLDEPFSALDAQTRIKISEDIYKMIKDEKLTAIMVTHDIAEAISIGDRVIVLSKRPAEIIKEYKIEFNDLSPFEKRVNPKFNQYFKQIWSDLGEK